MRINQITVENYQRLTSVNIPVSAPILLLAGENEAGKTSIADAIYHAITGSARRVAMKKDFKDLVHDGQKKGVIAIEVGEDDQQGVFTVTVPSDKRTIVDVDENPLMPYLLDAKRFTQIKPDERRTLLFGITGTRISAKTILEKLKEKGANTDKTVTIGAVMLGGFAAAHTEAKAQASESRGAWKEIAGEAYGKVKAEAWKAERPVFDPEKIAQLKNDDTAIKAKVSALQQEVGANAVLRTAQLQRQMRRVGMLNTIEQTERRTTKLAADQTLVDEWAAKVAHTTQLAGSGPKVVPIACPHCAGLVEIHAGQLTQHNPTKSGDPKSIALLPQHQKTLDQVTHARDNAKRDLDECVTAQAQLQELDASDGEPMDESDAALTQAALASCIKTADIVFAALNGQRAASDAAARADANTTRALRHHNDATDWDQIAEWLAPEGIQAELLKGAMDPFNSRLARTAKITGWPQASIDSDMTIRIGGRAHSLCSASAKWRAEASITEAISHVSKIRTFLLDEAEVLIGPNRLAFLKWMHQLAATGEVDTAIVIGSFKEKPVCPPTFQVEWIADGKAGQQKADQEPALA
ncbi:MAG: AAA family ATPase [Frankiaceae bacterium]|nr:AAA family ATPase [Arenimonas sp.]